jgi:hypothetical protein
MENVTGGGSTKHDQENKQDINTTPEQVPNNDGDTENPDESLLDGSSYLGENTEEETQDKPRNLPQDEEKSSEQEKVQERILQPRNNPGPYFRTFLYS